MHDEIKNSDKLIQQWLNSSDENFATMNNLMASSDYSWALFLGHLVLEKILKALYIKNKHQHAIFTHDLLRLAKIINLKLSEEQQDWLDEITTFNLNARYDNYKQEFSKLCTKEFTDIRITRIKTLRRWLINQF